MNLSFMEQTDGCFRILIANQVQLVLPRTKSGSGRFGSLSPPNVWHHYKNEFCINLCLILNLTTWNVTNTQCGTAFPIIQMKFSDDFITCIFRSPKRVHQDESLIAHIPHFTWQASLNTLILSGKKSFVHVYNSIWFKENQHETNTNSNRWCHR